MGFPGLFIVAQLAPQTEGFDQARCNVLLINHLTAVVFTGMRSEAAFFSSDTDLLMPQELNSLIWTS